MAILKGGAAGVQEGEVMAGRFAALGVAPVASTRASTAQTLKAEATRWQQVIKARGIKAEG